MLKKLILVVAVLVICGFVKSNIAFATNVPIPPGKTSKFKFGTTYGTNVPIPPLQYLTPVVETNTPSMMPVDGNEVETNTPSMINGEGSDTVETNTPSMIFTNIPSM